MVKKKRPQLSMILTSTATLLALGVFLTEFNKPRPVKLNAKAADMGCGMVDFEDNYVSYPPKGRISFQQMATFGCRPDPQGCLNNIASEALEMGSFDDRYGRYWYGYLPDNGMYSVVVPVCGEQQNNLGIFVTAQRDYLTKPTGKIKITLISPSGKLYYGLAPTSSPYTGTSPTVARCIFPAQYGKLEPGNWTVAMEVDKAAKDARLDVQLYYNYWRFQTVYPHDQPIRYSCPPEDMKWVNG